MSHVPSLSAFDPNLIPYQLDVIREVRTFDYSQGMLEVLLSGSVGCLREDAPVMTISGEVPIADITDEHFLVTHHDSSSQFALTRGSGAYPKGKGNLYRVVSEHGEFVANDRHLVATSFGTYQRVGDLYVRDASFVAPGVRYEKRRDSSLLWFAEDVLRCWQTVSSLMDHCVKRIHQCGQRLPLDLKNALASPPVSADAQEYGLFFYKNRLEHGDVPLVQEQARDHTSESPFRLSMHDFFHLVESKSGGEASAYTLVGSKPCSRSLKYILTRLLCQTHTAHPQDLLFFLSKFSNLLSTAFQPPSVSVADTTYKIEKLSSDEWYWDMKVPNTNNYVSAGAVHHNSAKSLLMAHLVVTHCLLYPKAVALIGRKSLPDLKKTLLDLILEHLEEEPWFDRSRDYNKTTGEVTIYHNKSKIICHSWGDGNYKKVRSYAISMAALEEITENDQDEFYKEIAMRIGRASHVPEKLLISATNPDGPSHWAYKRLILSKNPCTKVFYSLTEQNPFLPPGYAARIRETLSKEEATRMLEGQWIDIKREVIYYAFTQGNVISKYEVNPTYPIGMTWDFNIAAGKPMSMAYYQRINGIFIFFAEVVIHTGRTEDVLEEGYARDLIRPEWSYEIDGDASGKHGDTRNNVHDYDIIQNYLRRKNVTHKLVVPTFNPGVRDRHIKVNGQLCNANGKRQVYVVDECQYLIDGFSQSKLKKGSQYIEDDSDAFQHITTAAGYAIHRIITAEVSKSGVTVKRMR